MKNVLMLLLLYFGVANAGVIRLEPMGTSYHIDEMDFEEFMKARAAGVDFEKLVKENFDRSFKERATARLGLPSAQASTVIYHIPQHKLEHEIFTLDSSGHKTVIYPAGFEFNPLDYITLHEQYLVVNANNDKEITWLKSQLEDYDMSMILISEGYALDISDELERPVYVLDSFVQERFFIKRTPSLVKQEGNQIAVYEFCMDCREDEQ